jgi:hypothetical protein
MQIDDRVEVHEIRIYYDSTLSARTRQIIDTKYIDILNAIHNDDG